MTAVTAVKYISADGVDVFYREAGQPDAPVVLLLHGYPTSSFSYRNLIVRLAEKYRVIAPDLPGFGFTNVPAERNYQYTFANFAKTVEAFADALKLKHYALYIFDYGAPTGLRLALARPDAVTAIISQNGNAYVEGLGAFWDNLRPYWASQTTENRESIRWLTSFDATKWQYVTGEKDPSAIPPETYHLDSALLARPGNADIQLDIFLDYRTNVELYPAFQQFFRQHKPPILAIWGKNDEIFIPQGANAFKTDAPDAEVVLVDGGHFVLENHLDEVADAILKFLGKKLV
ncbi:Alpha/Beta hydrolase protein [Hygrophoropsis aurantiaca]|uniref:Alpha/Beta hydrolase protein n=1 Tax=Hygrophoropsis aurantiaca TaxID=72124 RepID=A0ACB8AAW3_9AGAM|nr:Alpha/Beta hydrolase protein [Hygrophoropsis aurantiaca]